MASIQSALISVYDKDGLKPILEALNQRNVHLISTGGTQRFIEEQGYEATSVESITDYPSILGGRVKTLHPKIFGGILARGETDQSEKAEYQIPEIDLVVVDLYPFAQMLLESNDEDVIIENIDIGGISLIRSAAKNFKETLTIPSKDHYEDLLKILREQGGEPTEDQKKRLASEAFNISASYDRLIQQYLTGDDQEDLPLNLSNGKPLRYGENPHQKAWFYGDFQDYFEQLNGKQISYNNLVDIDAAVRLIEDLPHNSFAVIKHTNPCGVAHRETLLEAWQDALAGDPVSAFGGILATNAKLDSKTAEAIDELFFEVLIAPDFDEEALSVLTKKQNRILLKQNKALSHNKEIQSVVDGYLVQEKDQKLENRDALQFVTEQAPNESKIEDLLFANIIAKHAKSNTIVLSKNKQLTGIGVGQTSRVDALKQAIEKAKHFELPLADGVMASDAFFPFSDSVKIAHEEGIQTVIQPGGSKRDQDSIDYCNEEDMAMVFTGTRHFKH